MRRAQVHAAWLAGAGALLGAAVLLGWADAGDEALGPRAAGGAGWQTVTVLGDTWALIGAGLAAAGMLWLLRGRLEAGVMAALLAVQFAVAWGLKWLVGRPRPEGVTDPASPAFPSGHTLGATAVYVGAAVLASPRQAPAILAAAALAAAVGWSRLALGVHHPSDVLGGWLAGAALVMLAHDLRSSIRAKQDARPQGPRRGGPPPPGVP